MRAGPEDGYEVAEEGNEGRSRRGVLSILVAALAVIAFGAAVWYAYTLGARSGSPSDVPLVTADQGPWKKRPEDPGGLKVANQDKSVYDRLDPDSSGVSKEERLLPPPEEPVDRPPPEPVAPAGPSGTLPTGIDITSGLGELPSVAEEPSSETPANTGEAAPAGEATATVGATGAEKTPPNEVASLPPSSTTTTSGAGAYRIQLAALRSEADAKREWQRIRSANDDLLGNLEMSVVRVDLGAEKGVFYRLQAGPVDDKSLADLLCGKLKSRSLGCLVVAR